MVEGLLQRLNCDKRPMVACALPIVAQLGLMHSRPFDHQPPRMWRQFAGDHGEALDVDGGLSLAVAGVEMWPATMVYLVVIYPDRDPVEAAYAWHLPSISFGENTIE
jgi:hypothetical protein